MTVRPSAAPDFDELGVTPRPLNASGIGVSVPTLDLADGRVLARRESGAVEGCPLVAAHGSPDSSAVWALLATFSFIDDFDTILETLVGTP